MIARGKATFFEAIRIMGAVGNMYGLLLLIVLCGSGLISLPRRLWQLSFPKRELMRLYILAQSVESDLNEARYELEDCEVEVDKLLASPRPADGSEINTIRLFQVKDLVSSFEFDRKSNSRRRSNAKGRSMLDEEYDLLDNLPQVEVEFHNKLVHLHARIIGTQARVRCCERRWHILLFRVAMIQSTLREEREQKQPQSLEQQQSDVGIEDDNTQSTNSDYNDVLLLKANLGLSHSTGNPSHSPDGYSFPFLSQASKIIEWGISYFMYQLHCFNPYTQQNRMFMRGFSVVLMVLSILVLWSQLVIGFDGLPSPISFMLNKTSNSNVGVQLICFLILLYMSVCAYYTLFSLKLGWYFTLQGPQQSPPSSLIFNAEQLSRLQFALGFNFLLSIGSDSAKETAFNEIVERMITLPIFGKSFSLYLPLLLVGVSCLVFFDVWTIILRILDWVCCGHNMDIYDDRNIILNEEDLDEDSFSNLSRMNVRHKKISDNSTRRRLGTRSSLSGSANGLLNSVEASIDANSGDESDVSSMSAAAKAAAAASAADIGSELTSSSSSNLKAIEYGQRLVCREICRVERKMKSLNMGIQTSSNDNSLTYSDSRSRLSIGNPLQSLNRYEQIESNSPFINPDIHETVSISFDDCESSNFDIAILKDNGNKDNCDINFDFMSHSYDTDELDENNSINNSKSHSNDTNDINYAHSMLDIEMVGSDRSMTSRYDFDVNNGDEPLGRYG